MSRHFDETVYSIFLELLKTKSLDEIKVSDITDRAGLTKQAFYYHGRNVPDYICKVIEKVTLEATNDCSRNIDLLMHKLDSALRDFRDNRVILTEMMFSNNKAKYLECFHKSIYKGVYDIVNGFFKRYSADSPETVAMVSGYITDTLYGVLLSDLESGMTADVTTTISSFKRFYGKPFSSKLEEFYLPKPEGPKDYSIEEYLMTVDLKPRDNQRKSRVQ